MSPTFLLAQENRLSFIINDLVRNTAAMIWDTVTTQAATPTTPRIANIPFEQQPSLYDLDYYISNLGLR